MAADARVLLGQDGDRAQAARLASATQARLVFGQRNVGVVVSTVADGGDGADADVRHLRRGGDGRHMLPDLRDAADDGGDLVLFDQLPGGPLAFLRAAASVSDNELVTVLVCGRVSTETRTAFSKLAAREALWPWSG